MNGRTLLLSKSTYVYVRTCLFINKSTWFLQMGSDSFGADVGFVVFLSALCEEYHSFEMWWYFFSY